MNAINVIVPYKKYGMWVFDDPRVGLVEEPFVGGADTMIDRVVADIPGAERGFNLIFFRHTVSGSLVSVRLAARGRYGQLVLFGQARSRRLALSCTASVFFRAAQGALRSNARSRTGSAKVSADAFRSLKRNFLEILSGPVGAER
jgi:hypothetical protein